MKTKPMRIKAFWSLYGVRIHRAGRNLDLGGGDGAYHVAAFNLLNLLEKERYTGEVEFYGNCSKEVEKEFNEYKSIG
jgi:hypothetical protein